MSLTFAQAPELRGLESSLADGLYQIGQGVEAGTPLDVLTPIPVYTLASATLRAGRKPHWIATPTWRTLVLSRGDPIATLQFRAPFQPHLAGIRDEDSARALYAAFEAAEEFAAKRSEDYEVRFVALPRLFVTAVWLAGKRSVFIPTRTGNSSRPKMRIFNNSNFLKLLRRRHRARAAKRPSRAAR